MPISKSAIKRGDIVVVPFPYSDQLAEKRRPALVVSGNKFNDRGFLWVVMITSKVEGSPPDVVQFDHNKAGLSKPSVVRVAKLATIEASRVLRVAGHMDSKAFNAVGKVINSILS